MTSLLAQVGQMFFHCLHFGFQLTQVSFQLADLLGFRLVATPEPAVATAALAVAASAVTAFTTPAAVMPMVAMTMSVSFIAAHSYPRFLFDGDGDRVATTDSYSATN
jgi:hypothetical protein